MKIMVLGADGYLGWPTCMHFSARGHEVYAVDSAIKRTWEVRNNALPLVRVPFLPARIDAWREITSHQIDHSQWDVHSRGLRGVINIWKPDAIIHYAEQPSAPYSMDNVVQCMETQAANILGTLSILWAIKDTDCHLVKLGTMGEYGTPNIDIEEGWLRVEHKGRSDRVLFPKSPGSFYHASKCADSINIELACRLWNMRATDLNQGIVYGCETDETKQDPRLATSFHYDAMFGTALNRFITQAVSGQPLTVYGEGGQTRGWLNIRDTLQCVELACKNPAAPGEFRVFNQFTEQYSVQELAERVAVLMEADISHIDNPRIESESHYYNATHTGLEELGLKPHPLTDTVLDDMIKYVEAHASSIRLDGILPGVTWR